MAGEQAKVVLLYTRREREIDEYEQLVRAARLPIDLRVCRTPAEAATNISDAEIVFGVHLPPEIYAQATKLKWIQSMWAGVEGLLKAPLPPDVVITKPWGVFGQYISQYVFGYLLAARIHLREMAEHQAAHRWQPRRIEPIKGFRLAIAGMGDIGRDIARVARSFGMEIWGLNRSGQASEKASELADRMFTTKELGDFAAGADALVIIMPATSATRGLFNKEIFARMKSHALLINVGRGAIIKDEDLISALTASQIAGAVLDVFVEEPLPADHPYWSLPNCIVTPHIGGPSLPADITRCFLENFQRYLSSEPLHACIDRESEY